MYFVYLEICVIVYSTKGKQNFHTGSTIQKGDTTMKEMFKTIGELLEEYYESFAH